MQEYKLVVLGSGGVGKSALTVKYVQDTYVEKYDPTIEDSYRKQTTIDNKECVLEILDTAGTEQFTAMRDLYMKNAQGFVICYSINNKSSFLNLPALYNQIVQVKNSKIFPMILVGTKCDMEHERVVKEEEGRRLADEWKCLFIESSAKNNLNVKEVFNKLVKQINIMSPVQRSRSKKKCIIL